MKISFIAKTDSRRLLLIYAGWSVEPEMFATLQCPGYDIAVVHDYSELSMPVINGYDEVVILAWSLGVHAAELTAANLPLTLTLAVNGTPYPVDDARGIPESTYIATARNLSEQSLQKFRRRMGAADMPRGLRSIESLRDELLNFPREHVAFRWDRAVISLNDRIFPPQNQLEAWNESVEITEIEGSHTPDFQSLVDRFVINKSLVSNRFTKGLSTYDSSSDVQQRIADHLFSLWQKHGLNAGTVLEIGVGTGYFTNLYKRFVSQTILWDIVPSTPEVELADAEVSLPKGNFQVDAIVSASTMQWFNSPAAFLQQCARVLQQGGLAVLSTFGPETFKELTASGVVPLPYLSESSLRRMIPDNLQILELHKGIITKVFNEPQDVLKHLKSTGVNARPCTRSLRELMQAYPRRDDGRCNLTYEPIYMILRKR